MELAVQLITALLITSGVFGGIVYMWKKMQGTQSQIIEENNKLISKVIENSEHRLDSEHIERVQIDKETVKTLQTMTREFTQAQNNVGDKMGNQYGLLGAKIDLVVVDIHNIKNDITEKTNHLIAGWSQVEHRLDERDKALKEDRYKTRNY